MKSIELDIKNFQCRIKRMKPKQSDIGSELLAVRVRIRGFRGRNGEFRLEHSWVLQVQVVGLEALTPPALVQPLTGWFSISVVEQKPKFS